MNEERNRNATEAEDLRALVLSAKEGDKEAFGALFTRFYVPVYRYALYRIGSREDADEVTQEVFLKAYLAFSRYDSERAPSPLPFFFTIARNTIIDRRRKERTIIIDPDLISAMTDDAVSSPEEDAVRGEEATMLYAALRGLSNDMREALTLRFMGGLSADEVGAVLGKSPEAVRQMQSRGMKLLRVTLEKQWTQ